MKRIKLLIISFAALLSLSSAMVPATVLADTPKSVVCQSLDSGADCNKTSNNSLDLNKVIKLVLNILSVVVGIAAVIMMVIGGMRYITSGGDSNNVSSAKNTIIYALVGLVIVAVAQLIVKFVLNSLGNGT